MTCQMVISGILFLKNKKILENSSKASSLNMWNFHELKIKYKNQKVEKSRGRKRGEEEIPPKLNDF